MKNAETHMQDYVRKYKGWDIEIFGDRKVCVTNIQRGGSNKVHMLEPGMAVQVLQGVIVLAQFAVHAERAKVAAVSSRPQATHPPSDHQQNYRSTSASYEPCLQTLLLAGALD